MKTLETFDTNEIIQLIESLSGAEATSAGLKLTPHLLRTLENTKVKNEVVCIGHFQLISFRNKADCRDSTYANEILKEIYFFENSGTNTENEIYLSLKPFLPEICEIYCKETNVSFVETENYYALIKK